MLRDLQWIRLGLTISVLFLLPTNIVSGQILAKGFSLERQKFLNQIKTYLSQSPLVRPSLYGDIFKYLLDLKEPESQLTIKAVNTLYARNVRSPIYYQSFFESLVKMSVVAKKNPLHIRSFLENIIEFSETHNHYKTLETLSKLSSLYLENQFEKNENFSWTLRYGGFIYDPDTIMKFKFYRNPQILLKKYGRSIEIRDVEGYYYPTLNKVSVVKGVFYWKKQRLAKQKIDSTITELYARVYDFDITLSTAIISVDSAVLFNSKFIDGEATGKLDVYHNPSDNHPSSSPRFKTYKTNYSFSNQKNAPFGLDVDFLGGFLYRDFKLFGVGDSENKAKLILKSDDKVAVLLYSDQFSISSKNIGSAYANFEVLLKNTSIFHPQVAFNYDIAKKKLLSYRNEKEDSKTPYLNDYDKIGMNLSDLAWEKSRANKVFFFSDAYNKVPFFSSRYYEKELINKYRGLAQKNPLSKMVQIYDLMDENTNIDAVITLEDLCQILSINQTSATHILMRMSLDGYVYFDPKAKTFRFTENLIQKTKAHRDLTDYDNIFFTGKTDTASAGYIDLDSGTVYSLGIEYINISESKNIQAFPDSGKVLIKKDMDFAFDGRVEVSNFVFFGDDYSFIYKDYKLKMNGNQKMFVKIPSLRPDIYNRYFLEPVKNSVDSLIGELYIDDPENKSGKEMNEDLPSFTSFEKSYVFYDHADIYDSAYDRNRFRFTVDPFTLDSMSSINSGNLWFEGALNSGGIFPTIPETLTVQPDYSYGFVRTTPDSGYSAYQGKGTYTDQISLNFDGLTGKGTVDYLTSSTTSEDIIFFLDSTHIKNGEMVMVEDSSILDAPSLKTPSVDVVWKPYGDTMLIKSNLSFAMYDSALVSKGALTLTPKALTGSAKANMETAYIRSDHMRFRSKSFESDNMDIKFRESRNSHFELQIDSAQGTVDVEKQTGHFKIPDRPPKKSSIDLPVSKYKAYVNSIDWDIAQKSFEAYNTQDSNATGENPWMVSTNPAYDSLRFQATSLNYSMSTKKTISKEVEWIRVGDAHIIPDSGRVSILRGGTMEKLANAAISIQKGPYEYHFLKKSAVNIYGRNDYRSDGTYDYISPDSVVTPIYFNKLSYQKDLGYTQGFATIKPSDEFKFDPYFSFDGGVELFGNDKNLRYKGYTSVESGCSTVETGKIPINSTVKPNDIKLKIGTFPGNKISTVYTGIYYENDAFNVAFCSNKKSLEKTKLTSTYGTISFQEKDSKYFLEDTASIDRLIFSDYYEDQCNFITQGRIFFTPLNKAVKIDAFGTHEFDLNASSIKSTISLGLNFFFPPSTMLSFFQDAFYSEGDEVPAYDLSNKIALAYLDPRELKKAKEQAIKDSILENQRKMLETIEKGLVSNQSKDSLNLSKIKRKVEIKSRDQKINDSVSVANLSKKLELRIQAVQKETEQQLANTPGAQRDSVAQVQKIYLDSLTESETQKVEIKKQRIQTDSDSVLLALQTEQSDAIDRVNFVKDSLQKKQIELSKILQADFVQKTNNVNRVAKTSPLVQRTLFLNNLKLEWDEDNKAFYQSKKIGVGQIDKKAINKMFRGSIEILFKKKNVEITIVIRTDQGYFYYFKFGKHLSFLTDNARMINTIKRLSPEDRTTEVNGKKFEIKIAKAKDVRDFEKKY